jgi:hypothetical protein
MSKVFDSKLPALERLVLLAMADFANDMGESIYPSVATMARKCGMSTRGVQTVVKRLLDHGYIELEKKGGGRLANLWKIVPDKLDEGCTPCRGGVHAVQGRGAPGAPYPSYNHHITDSEKPVSENDVQVKVTKEDVYKIGEALAEVTSLSMDINKSQILKEAAKLAKDKRVSPELIRQIYSKGGLWYTEDWRGKQGQKPSLYDVAKTIFAFYDTGTDGTIKGGLKDRPIRERGGLKR